MPARFYLHLVKGHQRLVDRKGVEMTRDAIMSPAIHDVVKEIWPGTSNGGEWVGWVVEVVDADGHVVRVFAL